MSTYADNLRALADENAWTRSEQERWADKARAALRTEADWDDEDRADALRALAARTAWTRGEQEKWGQEARAALRAAADRADALPAVDQQETDIAVGTVVQVTWSGRVGVVVAVHEERLAGYRVLLNGEDEPWGFARNELTPEGAPGWRSMPRT